MSSNSASPRMKRGMAGRGGPGRGRIKPSSNAGSQPSQNLEGLYSNDRLVNAVASVLGCNAKVSEKSGKQFQGVFKTMSPEASLVLGKANQVEEQKQNGVVDGGLQKIDIIEQFVMNRKDWVRVEFKDVNVEECYFTGGKKDSFKTDFAIGGNKRMNGQTKKELEKWEPGDGADSLETAALEGHHSMENGWTPEKMFEKNEKMYGVKSTYSEGMEEYTTKLDKNDTPEYRERERYAAQKAEEILKESPHERNIDSGRSEEQLYSSVVRSKTFDRTSTNWRQPHRDRPPEREQRTARLPQEGFGSPTSVKKEQARSQQTVEPPTVQVKEKIEKPATETPVECKPEQKVEEAFSDVVKAEAKPAQNQAKPLLTPANTPVTPQTTEGSTETLQDSSNSPDATTAKTRSKDNVKIQKELKEFAANFQLAESKKKPKAKKVSEEEQKTSTEATSKEEKNEEAQTSQEVKTDSEAEKQATSGLNPNAQEFRPRVKRNTPSPRSNSTPSSSGTPSPFQNNSPFQHNVYPPNNIYSRNGPRGRGMRQEYMDPGAGYVNATNATGQPFFAHHMPHQFMHQPSPPGMSYISPGGLRHPGLQHPVFIQQHPHQGPMMVPLGQIPPGHYPDNAIYYGHAMPAMIQSPPQITSPSLQQSQFNFPPPTMSQSVTPVRPVTQPPNVMSQQPSPPVLFVRNNEMQPTQIMTNRPPPPQSFQGN